MSIILYIYIYIKSWKTLEASPSSFPFLFHHAAPFPIPLISLIHLLSLLLSKSNLTESWYIKFIIYYSIHLISIPLICGKYLPHFLSSVLYQWWLVSYISLRLFILHILVRTMHTPNCKYWILKINFWCNLYIVKY